MQIKKLLWLRQAVFLTLFLLALFVFWEFASMEVKKLSFILPRPSLIALRIVETASFFWHHSSVTIQEIVLGFFFAFLLAFSLGGLMLRSLFASLTLQPLFVIIQCVPMFTLAPLMIFWFGWSKIAIIIPTALMIFLPLTLNIYRGLVSTPHFLVDFFQVNGATQWKIFYKLRLPWALPQIFSGLRISVAVAGVGAIGGEWAGAQEGLGLLMQESRRNADFEMAFAALFCLIIISLIFYTLLLTLEKILLRKHSTQRTKVC